MPNISGQYNFNELCLEARASAPWVKKVQRLLKLGEGEGSKGARTYYGEAQVHVYSTVKKLRLMDLEFDEIKRLFELEKELKALSSSTVPKSDIKGKTRITLCPILVLPAGQALVFDHVTFSKDKKEKVMDLIGRYQRALEYVEKKAQYVQSIANELAGVRSVFDKANIVFAEDR